MINTQPIEKKDFQPDGSLEIQEIFYTIQGEGPFAGLPAIFIRLAGCNLQCPNCDTDYTTARKRLSAAAIAEYVVDMTPTQMPKKLVVLTGGEPFRQNLDPLVRNLLIKNYDVQIETNGTLYQELPYYHTGLTVVCSPKAGKVNERLAQVVKSYKYVMSYDEKGMADGLPTQVLDHTVKSFVARPPINFPKERIYLQPADYKDDKLNKLATEKVVRSCLQHGYRLCLQVHKIVNLP